MKDKFICSEDEFEIDALAYGPDGEAAIGVDIKRIEATRDTHKRADEIVNKAVKFKSVYPNARFVAVVYYPFQGLQSNLERRLTSDHVSEVCFASSRSLGTAIGLLVDTLQIRKPAEHEM